MPITTPPAPEKRQNEVTNVGRSNGTGCERRRWFVFNWNAFSHIQLEKYARNKSTSERGNVLHALRMRFKLAHV